MWASYLDVNGENQARVMCCCGIEVWRLLAAAAEQHHSAQGIASRNRASMRCLWVSLERPAGRFEIRTEKDLKQVEFMPQRDAVQLCNERIRELHARTELKAN